MELIAVVKQKQQYLAASNVFILYTSLHFPPAFPLPFASSNFPFHFSSCLNSIIAAIALGVPWSGSAPPSSNVYLIINFPLLTFKIGINEYQSDLLQQQPAPL